MSTSILRSRLLIIPTYQATPKQWSFITFPLETCSQCCPNGLPCLLHDRGSPCPLTASARLYNRGGHCGTCTTTSVGSLCAAHAKLRRGLAAQWQRGQEAENRAAEWAGEGEKISITLKEGMGLIWATPVKRVWLPVV